MSRGLFAHTPAHFHEGTVVSPSISSLQLTDEQFVASFFQRSAGQWRSERRYYTLPDGETQELVSLIQVRFLSQGSPELIHLAALHHLSDPTSLTCGAEVIWESALAVSGRPQSKGSTVFGVAGDILYRDRGFATTKPITASFYFPTPNSFCLRTEYKGSVFEEEIKLIGQQYRTRQTVISRSGEQVMIGQYLEKRLV
nr:phycobiliprotein lyase [Trichothermofontia sichuanensis]